MERDQNRVRGEIRSGCSRTCHKNPHQQKKNATFNFFFWISILPRNKRRNTNERERKKEKILRLERFIETFLPLSLSSLPSRPFGSKMNVLNNNNRTGEFEKGDKLTHATEREWGERERNESKWRANKHISYYHKALVTVVVSLRSTFRHGMEEIDAKTFLLYKTQWCRHRQRKKQKRDPHKRTSKSICFMFFFSFLN